MYDIELIRHQAFYCCNNIGDVYLPDSVTSIGIRAFAGCNAEDITVDLKNKMYASIDGVLFNKTKTVLVLFPGARSGSYAMPDGVISVASNAFANCQSLKEVYIPKSVKKLEDGAFISCSSLAKAYFYGDAPGMGDHVFDYTGRGLQILHPAGNKTFKNPWHGYITGVFSPESLSPAGQADLAVTDIKWSPVDPMEGTDITFSAIVKNQGTAAVEAGMVGSVVFYVDGELVGWSDTIVESIQPGASSIITPDKGQGDKAAWAAEAGTHVIDVTVDKSNNISESRERNNTLEKTIEIK